MAGCLCLQGWFYGWNEAVLYRIWGMPFYFISNYTQKEILSVDRLKKAKQTVVHRRRGYLFALHQHCSTWINGSLWESSVKLGEKEVKEGRREGVLSDLKALYLSWVVVALPVWQCKSSARRKKGPPFLPVGVKTELTAELILIVYSLELKTGTPNICEL